MTTPRMRVTVVLTHPVQYFSPWFRYIHNEVHELELEVLYAVEPSSQSQSVGFGQDFAWDQPLRDGYSHRVLGATSSDVAIGADEFSNADAPDLEQALLSRHPDAVVIPGWHAAIYRRAIQICRRHGIPAIYRGDSNLLSGPSSSLARAAWRVHTRRRLREYAAYLSVGVRSRDYLRAFGAPEPLIFDSPHAVDNAFFAAASELGARTARAQWGLDPDRFTVAFVGKLESKKHPIDLVKAVAAVPEAQLLIVGSGALERACRDEAARLGLRAVLTGFINQSGLRTVFGAANCIALPSDGRETWGLVVNEALAAGVPAIVSDQVGCAPDLVIPGETGAVVPCGDVPALSGAIRGLMTRHAEGHDFGDACRTRAERYGFAAATAGLIAACARLQRRTALARVNRSGSPAVLAWCGHMVTPGGLERMTFEVLNTARRNGANVHCLVNKWSSSRIVALAEQNEVAWSPAVSDHPLRRRTSSPFDVARMIWEVVRASADLLRATRAQRTTHVLLPDFLVAVRLWPALALLRLQGRTIILRVGMAPSPGRFYAWLWRWIVNPVVDRMVSNSEFLFAEVRRLGVPARKRALIRNTSLSRATPLDTVAKQPRRIVYVGQTIPDKGLDILIEAVGRVREDGIAATLDVVGEMTGWESPSYAGYRDRLRQQAAAPNLRGSIQFLGHREDVMTILSGAMVHCCPSRQAIREGMANVVLEAKAAGVPSLVTRSGSLPELVTDGVDGWLVDDNAVALAHALRRILGDRDACERAGTAARQSLQRFGRTIFDQRWLAELGMAGEAARAHLDQASLSVDHGQ